MLLFVFLCLFRFPAMMRALATSDVLCHHGWAWVTVTRDSSTILQISGANCWARSLISGKEWEKLQGACGTVSSRETGWCFPTCSIICVLGARGCSWASQLSQALQAAWEQSEHKNQKKNQPTVLSSSGVSSWCRASCCRFWGICYLMKAENPCGSWLGNQTKNSMVKQYGQGKREHGWLVCATSSIQSSPLLLQLLVL